MFGSSLGWSFVSNDVDTQGWVPATYLEPLEGIACIAWIHTPDSVWIMFGLGNSPLQYAF
jgi:hypothetical protein